MKISLTIALFFAVLAFRPLVAPSTQGAWQKTNGNETTLLLVADNYFMQTVYTPTAFIRSQGGTWKQNGTKLAMTIEFDTRDSTRVGTSQTAEMAYNTNQMAVITPSGQQVMTRVDELSGQTPMAGLWRITARANNEGVVTPMQRGARKTLKLLTGTRFQWAAINPETKQFSGTGGGTYTLKDGKYTETIAFFSRDNSRVGKSLTFDNKVTGTDWTHTGLSSTGGKVHEVWSREKEQ